MISCSWKPIAAPNTDHSPRTLERGHNQQSTQSACSKASRVVGNAYRSWSCLLVVEKRGVSVSGSQSVSFPHDNSLCVHVKEICFKLLSSCLVGSHLTGQHCLIKSDHVALLSLPLFALVFCVSVNSTVERSGTQLQLTARSCPLRAQQTAAQHALCGLHPATSQGMRCFSGPYKPYLLLCCCWTLVLSSLQQVVHLCSC